MTIKKKILDALDCTLEDISEERLIDILLDAYTFKITQLEMLKGENAREREKLHHEREMIQRERDKMRSDPLYLARGNYFFRSDKQTFYVTVQGSQIQLSERIGNADRLIQPISAQEFNQR